MNDRTREKLLKVALLAFGAIFLVVYPLGLVWPSGWVWHGGEGKYYFQMICGVYAVLGAYLIAAARKPSEHRSLISFAIWSSVVPPALRRLAPEGRRHAARKYTRPHPPLGRSRHCLHGQRPSSAPCVWQAACARTGPLKNSERLRQRLSGV
jgi:hypothetical protein